MLAHSSIQHDTTVIVDQNLQDSMIRFRCSHSTSADTIRYARALGKGMGVAGFKRCPLLYHSLDRRTLICEARTLSTFRSRALWGLCRAKEGLPVVLWPRYLRHSESRFRPEEGTRVAGFQKWLGNRRRLALVHGTQRSSML